MAEEISFSTRVKEELAHLLPTQDCCRRAELAALVRACGRITIGGRGRLSCSLATDHASVARKLIRLVKAGFPLHTEVIVMRRHRLRKNLQYVVRVPAQPGLMGMLRAVGIIDGRDRLQEWSNEPNLEHDHCRRAYLRGAFLGNGWVASPERQHHLEMTTTATEAADALGQLLFSYGLPVRMMSRKETLVLYLKDAEHVSQFLAITGAHESLLYYEDVRAMKEMRNRVNRQVNAETANLGKTADAAARQVAALDRLRANGLWESLAPGLQELATLRLQNPDASLKELGEMCHPPVGKSGVNHRMRQLLQLVESDPPFIGS